jgi:phage/plasmid-like protein (TIGR03299 family)
MSHGITSNDSMFSVRQQPWHGLGVVLPDYPRSIEEALHKSGLGWAVRQGEVQVVARPEWRDDFGVVHPATIVPAPGWRANLREDTGEVLGIVTVEYQVVPNRDAFRFLDALINSELYYETAGSHWGGRRVWVLARRPDYIEVGGDPTATYLYVANSHDGSLAVTAAATPIRIVCANTLGAALRRSQSGQAAQRTFRLRHTGDLQAKFEEARKVIGMTINHERQFKELGDRLAREAITEQALERRVLGELFPAGEDLGRIARANRERTIASILELYRGRGAAGDTTGNSPHSKWCAWNAIAEHQDHERRVTRRSNQMVRSFEDLSVKQRALELLIAA